MQIIIDDLLTTFYRSGKGRVIVLIHGWADQASGLNNIQKELSKNYDVIAPDLPGFGGSQPPQGVWDLQDYASFIDAFLKKIDIKNVYAYITHSNGGAIVIHGLGKEQLVAEKLVLLASAGIRGVDKNRIDAIRYATKAGKILAKPLPGRAQKRLRSRLYQKVGSDMLVAEHMQETFKKIVAHDVRDDAAKVSIPSLLIYGEADESTPVRYGEVLHQLLEGSTLEILPGAGHFVHLDRPREVIKAINGFLK